MYQKGSSTEWYTNVYVSTDTGSLELSEVASSSDGGSDIIHLYSHLVVGNTWDIPLRLWSS